MTTAAPGSKRPKESLFYDPILYLIGKATNFQPYVGVDHHQIEDDALRLAGIDPENCPWPLKSTSSKSRDGLYRVVHFGWYHQTHHYRKGKALCCQPFDPASKDKRGYWALTALGVKKAKDLRKIYEEISISAPRPKESLFYDPILYLIGKATGFRPYVGVDHHLIESDALRLAGIDPENCPWPLKSDSSKNRDGLLRVVHFGWYHQTHHYRPKNEALCCQPFDRASKDKRGYWALTALGAKKAKDLRKIYEGQISELESGPNTTARFLGENWERFYPRITLALQRKMPKSYELNKIDDHAMNWVEKIIQRDGLRTRIEGQRPPVPSQVSGWARRAAYTEIRDEAREPVCRIFHGSLTPKELKENAEVNWTDVLIPRTINESEILGHNRYAAHNDEDVIDDITESIQDSSALVEETVANHEAFGLCLDQVTKILMEEISEELDPKFHAQLLHDRFVKEMTVREIAEAHGMGFPRGENRIKIALNRVRDVMLQARENGEFDDFLSH